MHLSAYLAAGLVPPRRMAGEIAVVIDVLRATTTIVAALDAGASAVLPCLTVRQARLQRDNGFGRVILGGERGGTRIRGFELGNSPSEYTPAAVAGREVALTTTNGTRALLRCKAASMVAIAAFTNRSAVVDWLARCDKAHLVCAGTNGNVTLEDALLTGCLVQQLTHRVGPIHADDAARLCQVAWQESGGDGMTQEQLYQLLGESQGGRNLIQLGLDDDVRDAARLDRSSSVPVLHSLRGRIELA